MHVNTALSNLARSVTFARESKGYSIAALAQSKNQVPSESTIRRIEKACTTGYNPTLATLVKLANGLNVPVGTLVGMLGQQKVATHKKLRP